SAPGPPRTAGGPGWFPRSRRRQGRAGRTRRRWLARSGAGARRASARSRRARTSARGWSWRLPRWFGSVRRRPLQVLGGGGRQHVEQGPVHAGKALLRRLAAGLGGPAAHVARQEVPPRPQRRFAVHPVLQEQLVEADQEVELVEQVVRRGLA